MEAKSEVAPRIQIRRGLSLPEAALYIGVGSTAFLKLVNGKRMPSPRLVGSRRVWDVVELDAAFIDLPYEGENAAQPKLTSTELAWERHRAKRRKP